MHEGKLEIINLSDNDPDAVQVLLEYLHKGTYQCSLEVCDNPNNGLLVVKAANGAHQHLTSPEEWWTHNIRVWVVGDK
jgi:hypothetical protein